MNVLINFKAFLYLSPRGKGELMLENESTVNAEQVEAVTPQETIEVEQTESVQSEVAPDTASKTEVEQSPEENAKFKEIRLKYEREKQEAIDKEYSQMYGEQYGIHTKADYEKAIRAQKEAEMLEQLREQEVDPKEIYKALKENDPDYQELQKIKAESYTQNQLKELNDELKELDIDLQIKSLDDIASLDNADKIVDHIKAGKTLSEAYFLANKKQLIQKEAEKVRQDTLEKTLSLKGSSPGALDQSAGTEHTDSYSTMSADDFNKLKEDVLMGRRK